MADRVSTTLSTKLNDNTYGADKVDIYTKDMIGNWTKETTVWAPRTDDVYEEFICYAGHTVDAVKAVFQRDAGRDDWGETKYKRVATTQVGRKNMAKMIKDHNDYWDMVGQ